MLYYAGHILAAYHTRPEIDIYRVNGPMVEQIELQRHLSQTILGVDSIGLPRLDWQDREFDTI